LWNGKKMLDLGKLAPLSGSESWASGINDSGQVVGGTWAAGDVEHAFLYSNGIMTRLPEPSFTDGSACEATSINNAGQIAGVCAATSGDTHLVLWQNGAVSDLGVLVSPGTNPPGVPAVSLNNNGQIAGTVRVNGTSEGFLYANGTITNLGGFLAASINDNGVMVGGPSIDSGGTVQDLNTLIPAGSGPQIQNATAINDHGQIVADGLLLTPS
jgi:probable HAF family extracellular repeat protein